MVDEIKLAMRLRIPSVRDGQNFQTIVEMSLIAELSFVDVSTANALKTIQFIRTRRALIAQTIGERKTQKKASLQDFSWGKLIMDDMHLASVIRWLVFFFFFFLVAGGIVVVIVVCVCVCVCV
jgi:hypothetical protein